MLERVLNFSGLAGDGYNRRLKLALDDAEASAPKGSGVSPVQRMLTIDRNPEVRALRSAEPLYLQGMKEEGDTARRLIDYDRFKELEEMRSNASASRLATEVGLKKEEFAQNLAEKQRQFDQGNRFRTDKVKDELGRESVRVFDTRLGMFTDQPEYENRRVSEAAKSGELPKLGETKTTLTASGTNGREYELTYDPSKPEGSNRYGFRTLSPAVATDTDSHYGDFFRADRELAASGRKITSEGEWGEPSNSLTDQAQNAVRSVVNKEEEWKKRNPKRSIFGLEF